MGHKCEHCSTTLSSRSSLVRHQRTSIECLKLQGKEVKILTAGECHGCGKAISRNERLVAHVRVCPLVKQKRQLGAIHSVRTEKLSRAMEKLQNTIDDLQAENKQEYLRGRLDATREINENLIGLDIAQGRVKALEKKYLRKQKRICYPHKHVVYLITNHDLRERRTYIVGSATSLENRLSTYNKTAEHTVSYFSKCVDKENMKLFESMILKKLSAYRELPNRDRFILPEGRDISFFIDIYKEGEQFLELSGEIAISKVPEAF